MEEKQTEFMNDERCALLFHTLELLLKDYLGLLQAVGSFANAKEKIFKHMVVAKEMCDFIEALNQNIKEESKTEQEEKDKETE